MLGLPGDQLENPIFVFDLSHTNWPSVSMSLPPIQAVQVRERIVQLSEIKHFFFQSKVRFIQYETKTNIRVRSRS